jgi:hypothetical protein
MTAPATRHLSTGDRVADDLRIVASRPEGMRVLRWLIYDLLGLERAGLVNDPLALAAIEGQRSVALQLVTQLRAIDLDLAVGLLQARIEALIDAAKAPKEKPDAR